MKTAFGGTNHHHGPCELSLRSLRTGLRRGGAKIPEIRKHPPETGPQNRPENRVNTPPEGSRDSFRQRKPLTLRRFHKNRRKSSQGCEANSLLTGKLTGKFADSCLSARFLRPVDQQIQGLAGKFPTQPNREFFEFEQGIESRDQGIFSVEEGIRIASLIQSAVRSAIRIVAAA